MKRVTRRGTEQNVPIHPLEANAMHLADLYGNCREYHVTHPLTPAQEAENDAKTLAHAVQAWCQDMSTARLLARVTDLGDAIRRIARAEEEFRRSTGMKSNDAMSEAIAAAMKVVAR